MMTDAAKIALFAIPAVLALYAAYRFELSRIGKRR